MSAEKFPNCHTGITPGTTRNDLQRLFYFVCGYHASLRLRGIGQGDPQYNDACFWQHEVERHYQESFGKPIPFKSPLI